jgi:isopentenyl diphosphate isomerase/L-lactate dehydrogenase-like FMN-dependent dehydrogenase
MIISSGADYRQAARAKLPRFLFDYLDGGSYAEATLRDNIGDLSSLHLRQRVLRKVAALALSTTLFGEEFAMPVGLAPVGLGGMNARRGEVQVGPAARPRQHLALSRQSDPARRLHRLAGRPFRLSIEWKDLERIRDFWRGPIIVKGILDPDDARDALRFGAQGIVVSNSRRPPIGRRSVHDTGAACNRRSGRRCAHRPGRFGGAIRSGRGPDAGAGSEGRAAGSRRCFQFHEEISLACRRSFFSLKSESGPQKRHATLE